MTPVFYWMAAAAAELIHPSSRRTDSSITRAPYESITLTTCFPTHNQSNAYELVTESPGEGACPYQENQNVTSLFVGK